MTINRSLDDARAKHELLGQYIAECERVEKFTGREIGDEAGFSITEAEMLEVFERRRDRLYNELTNKGIKLHTEATDTLPSIARAREGME